LRDIADCVKNRNCVLFLGAGIHAEPPDESGELYPADKRRPMGSQLSRRLADDSGLVKRRPCEDCGNLQRVALDYEIHLGRTPLLEDILF
jgi:hypothetical protein